MAEFSWLAVDSLGNEQKGSMEANDQMRVYESLKSKGLIPIEVKEQSILNKDLDITIGKKVKPRELSIFCRQFVSIITAGVAIKEALSMLHEQTENKHLKKAIWEVMVELEGGSGLAEAMAMQDKIFPPILVNMVEAGENSGSLDTSFARVATHFEKEAHLKSMVQKATVYPIILVFVTIAVIIVMLTFVIPQFVTMFQDLDTQMPAVTLMVMGASDFLIHYWYILLAVVALIFAGLQMFIRTPDGRSIVDNIKIRIPIFGKLVKKTACAKMARTLSTLLAAGVPLVQALEMTATNMDNVHYKEAVLDAREEVMKGIPFSQPLQKAGHLFPPVTYHMISIGEDTGNLEGMMDKLADYYDEEVEMTTQSVMAAIEPLIIVVMAFVVGFIVIAVLLPMTTLYDTLSGVN
ncbi:MAG: type II secretion system F family protein [Lachnospiraceae bacterium]|nr:type II secretion system F family protein [Lachnospiraceae bacterium]